MNGHQKKAFSCLIGALNSPRKVNGYGADYAAKEVKIVLKGILFDQNILEIVFFLLPLHHKSNNNESI